jgi:hypothetical protein
MIGALINAHANYGYKPLHMTEYVRLDTTPNFDMGMRFAWHIYNCLYYLQSTSYFNWTLFRGPGYLGGIVTLTSDDYIIRPQYWFLKAYTHFTGKDWSLLGTSVSGPGYDNLRMSAFKSPDDTQLTIVILNKSTARTVITMPNYMPKSSAVYKSGQTLTWAYFGSFTPEMWLPPESITTIWMDRRPTANAGPEQAVNAVNGVAQVPLDGSDSNDLLGNELTYFWTWTIDSSTYQANGVNPVIDLPVGKHTIELIVNDGLLDSQPDYVDVDVIGCLSSGAPEYADWTVWGKPDCWCYDRQCRGDIDGRKIVSWVSLADLNLLKSAFNKADTILKNIPNGICADINHAKTGGLRVQTADFHILKSFFDKAETSVPCCDANADCALQENDKYNFWTN